MSICIIYYMKLKLNVLKGWVNLCKVIQNWNTFIVPFSIVYPYQGPLTKTSLNREPTAVVKKPWSIPYNENE
jgi:hypothetical protein